MRRLFRPGSVSRYWLHAGIMVALLIPLDHWDFPILGSWALPLNVATGVAILAVLGRIERGSWL